MRLSKEVLPSQLLPKISGTYEKEVQDCIKEFSGLFDKFIDIGCAEDFMLLAFLSGRKYQVLVLILTTDLSVQFLMPRK